MSDALKIWGTEYTGVKGFKAKDSSNNQYAYLRPQGTKSITENGNNIDVSEYASASVNVDRSGGHVIQEGSFIVIPADEVDSGWSDDDIATKSAPSGVVVLSTSSDLEDYALYGRNGITSISAPNVTKLKGYVFKWCEYLVSASFPSLTSMGVECFADCHALKSITLPTAITSLPTSTFFDCYALENIDFSHITTIGNSCFRNAQVKGCLFDPVTIGSDAFRDAVYFGVSYFPNVTTINGQFAFGGCIDSTRYSTVTELVFPSVTSSLGTDQTISYNDSLVSIDLGSPTSIPTRAFIHNDVMSILIIRNSSITTLGNVNAFDSTPFASGGTGGTLYVPNDLISSYQSATNWSTILGYANNQIKSIESTHTDPNATIDLTLYYADGTEIPST